MRVEKIKIEMKTENKMRLQENLFSLFWCGTCLLIYDDEIISNI